MRVALIAFAGWWLFFCALTVSVVRDSLRRQNRGLSRVDVLAIISGPLFWLECLAEATREARSATAIAQPDPIKPDYQPGDEVAVFNPRSKKKAA